MPLEKEKDAIISEFGQERIQMMFPYQTLRTVAVTGTPIFLVENSMNPINCQSCHQAIIISAPDLSPLASEFPLRMFTVFSREEAAHFRPADGVDRRN